VANRFTSSHLLLGKIPGKEAFQNTIFLNQKLLQKGGRQYFRTRMELQRGR